MLGLSLKNLKKGRDWPTLDDYFKLKATTSKGARRGDLENYALVEFLLFTLCFINLVCYLVFYR